MDERIPLQAGDAGPTGTTGSPGRDKLAQLLLEHAPEALLALSPEGTVLYSNRGARMLFPESPPDPVGSSFVDAVVPDEARTRASLAIAEALAAGRASFRATSRRGNGSPISVEAQLTCLWDSRQVPIVAVSARDMSEQVRLHEAEATEAKFRGLLEAAPDAMVILRSDRTISLVNGQVERMFGYQREELLGQPVEILVPDRFRNTHVVHRERYYADPHTRPMGVGLELYGRRKDGTEFPVEISLSPMRTGEGTLVTAAIRDITDRKIAEMERQRAEDAIRKLNKELEAFSYSVSHDLRAPLRAIDGFSQVLLEDFAEKLDATAREHLGRIRQASQRMAQLIDDLLALSRLNRTEMRHARVDLSAIGRAIAADLQGRDRSRTVSWDIAPGLEATGDPRLLQIALTNLLENAWKFTRQQPDAAVVLGARNADGERVFFVQDNGVGFDMQYASKLFSPFQRLHAQAEFEGTGIGLVTVQRIVHRHGGHIWAEAAPGHGATFCFTLGDSNERS